MADDEKTHVPPASPPDTRKLPVPPQENAAAAPTVDLPDDTSRLSLTTLVVLGVILILQYAQSFFIPIVLGILISYALAPLVGGLQRVRVPRAIGAAVAVTMLVGAMGLGAYTLSDEAMSIVSNVPEAAKRVRERVRAHRASRGGGGALQKMQDAASEIDRAAQEASRPSQAEQTRAAEVKMQTGVQKVEIVQPPFRATEYLWSGGIGLVGFGGQFVLVLFLVYFFLVTGDLYKRKFVKIAGPTLSQKKVTVQILDEINQQIASFMRVQVFTSLIVALATGAALWWLGVENYVLWGLLSGIFNSIPYLGPVLVTGSLGVVAFLQFDDVARTSIVCAVTFAITSLEGFLLTPMLMGRAAQMNPVAIFIGLLFWSWMWGIWGTVLAVPMLMMLKAVCDHVEDLQPIGELLGE
jgi:predicted PurR-regulated permease PerM